MKTKKQLFALLVLFLIMGGTNVYGQGIEGTFSVSPNPVTIEAGGTAEVTLNLSNYSAFTGYQFALVLPEGITLTTAKQNKGAYPTVDDPDEGEIKTHSMTRATQTDGSIVFICSSTQTTDPFVATKMVTLTLQAASDATGNLNAKLKNIALSTSGGVGVTPTDVSFTISIAEKCLETDDNAAWLESNNGKSLNIQIDRTLEAGDWNTFAVPFDISSGELTALGITAKKLTASSFNNGELTLTFSEALSIEAGKPYLVKVSANVVNPTFNGVTISKTAVPNTTTDAVNFIPSLGKTLVTGPAGDEDNPKAVLFLGADNKLIHPTVVNNSSNAASYIKGYRAYFQLKGQAALARKATLNFGGNNTTGITLIDNGQLRSDNVVYDLQGRQVVAQPTQKGVYIVNGKKLIIK